MPQFFTLAQFNQLSTPEKYGLLEDFGTYLEAYHIQGPHKIALFELYGYYVEVWLNQKSDQLIRAKAFTSYDKLDPFLASIDLRRVYASL